MNIIPTTTGAAKAIGLVMPELKGKLHGLSLKLPTSTVSIVDLVVDLEKPASTEAVNDALRTAADGALNGILGFCDEPLVSSNFRGNAASSIVDGPSTVVMEGKPLKFYPGTITSGATVAEWVIWPPLWLKENCNSAFPPPPSLTAIAKPRRDTVDRQKDGPLDSLIGVGRFDNV